MAKFLIKDVEVRQVAGRTPVEFFVWGHLEDPKNKFAQKVRTFTCFAPSFVNEVRGHIGATKNGTITDEEAQKPEHQEALKKLLVISPAAIEEFVFAPNAHGMDKWFVSLTAGTQTERTLPIAGNKKCNLFSDGTIVCKDRTTVVAQYEWVMVPDPNNIVLDEDGELVCNKVLTDNLGRPVSKYKDGFSPNELGESVRQRLWMSVRRFLEENPTLKDKLPDVVKADIIAAEAIATEVIDLANPGQAELEQSSESAF